MAYISDKYTLGEERQGGTRARTLWRPSRSRVCHCPLTPVTAHPLSRGRRGTLARASAQARAVLDQARGAHERARWPVAQRAQHGDYVPQPHAASPTPFVSLLSCVSTCDTVITVLDGFADFIDIRPLQDTARASIVDASRRTSMDHAFLSTHGCTHAHMNTNKY